MSQPHRNPKTGRFETPTTAIARLRPRTLALAVAAATLIAAVALASSPAQAQGNSGTIKVHDGPDADPDTRNEPHVTGDVFVEGMNMAADGGDLLFYTWPPTGDMTLVLATTWSADDGEPASHFLAGPFTFDACGHYRVLAYNGDGPDDPSTPQPGGAKDKMFWVEGCTVPPCESDCTPCETDCNPCETDCAPCETDCQPALECPGDLLATANDDGSVTLTFTPADGSDGTNVYRAVGDGDFAYLTTVAADATEYTDDTTVAGQTYTYAVTALYGDAESSHCPVTEVTTIPVFPTTAAFGLATALGLGAYVLVARRRAP